MLTKQIDNTANVLDSCDIISRLEDLNSDLECLLDAIQEAEDDEDKTEALAALAEWLQAPIGDLEEATETASGEADFSAFSADEFNLARWVKAEDLDDCEAAELLALRNLADEAEGCADWKYGETLIHESHFQDYAEELANDCCDMPKNPSWPMNCIDWEQAARELKYDYSEVNFAGETYFIRS